VPTEIGPRSPRRLPPSAVRGPGFLFSYLGRRFVPKTQEQKDEDAVGRVQRLAAFVEGRGVERVWQLDVAPLLEEHFDRALAQVMDGTLHTDALKVLNGLYGAIDRAGDLTTGAAARLAERHLANQAAAEAAKEQQQRR
jgi:hypothetical protein